MAQHNYSYCSTSSPMIGRTQKGDPCKRCRKIGNLCHQHIHQQGSRSGSRSAKTANTSQRQPQHQTSSSSSSQNGIGVTQRGEPCKRCIKCGHLCHQHAAHQNNTKSRSTNGTSHSDSQRRSQPKSSYYQSKIIFGMTKNGEPCMRCLQQRTFCWQHQNQNPKGQKDESSHHGFSSTGGSNPKDPFRKNQSSTKPEPKHSYYEQYATGGSKNKAKRHPEEENGGRYDYHGGHKRQHSKTNTSDDPRSSSCGGNANFKSSNTSNGTGSCYGTYQQRYRSDDTNYRGGSKPESKSKTKDHSSSSYEESANSKGSASNQQNYRSRSSKTNSSNQENKNQGHSYQGHQHSSWESNNTETKAPKSSSGLNDHHYKVLGVKPGSSKSEIKKEYMKLVRIYHPDKNNEPEAKTKFLQVQEAWEALREIVA